MSTNSQEIPPPSVAIDLKLNHLKFNSNLTVANGLRERKSLRKNGKEGFYSISHKMHTVLLCFVICGFIISSLWIRMTYCPKFLRLFPCQCSNHKRWGQNRLLPTTKHTNAHHVHISWDVYSASTSTHHKHHTPSTTTYRELIVGYSVASCEQISIFSLIWLPSSCPMCRF